VDLEAEANDIDPEAIKFGLKTPRGQGLVSRTSSLADISSVT